MSVEQDRWLKQKGLEATSTAPSRMQPVVPELCIASLIVLSTNGKMKCHFFWNMMAFCKVWLAT